MTLLSADSFDRANSVGNLGDTDGAGVSDPLTWGQPFPGAGTWDISSNRATRPDGSTEAYPNVEDEAGRYVECRVHAVDALAYVGPMALFSSSSNWCAAVVRGTDSDLRIYQEIGGSQTRFPATTGPSTAFWQTGDLIGLEVNGSTLTAYLNGDAVLQTTLAGSLEGSGVGIASFRSLVEVDDWAAYSQRPVVVGSGSSVGHGVGFVPIFGGG